MSARSQARATPSGTTFELERFELVEGERYEVEGRWSGVRGRVFIRPELTLIDGSQSRRLLADLAQKPWQATDGDPWAAAFPCAGQPVDPVDAELTVAPDITVAVKRGRTRRTRAAQKDEAQNSRVLARRSPESPTDPRARSGPGGSRRGLGVQLAEAERELDHVRSEHGRLSDRLDSAIRRVEEARAERDRATKIREELTAERDDAIRERDDALAERGQAIREAAVDREVVQRNRDDAVVELEEARSELERALDELQATATERDAAIRAGVGVERELHAANTARNALLEDREQLINQQNLLQREVQRLTAAAGESRIAPSSFWNDADRWTHSSRTPWRNRVVALLALAAAVVVVLILVLKVF